jgi:phosphate transport system substrate-binding protein
MKIWLFFLYVGLIACHNTRTIEIKGSDTEVNVAARLAEDFYKTNPSFNLSVSGGGSGLGIASLINGEADIANSSRPMTPQEIEILKKRKIEFDTFAFAEDAVAFVVSKSSSVDSLTVEQLANILSGKVRNWSLLTGKNLPINIYGRQSNSGTYEFVKDKLNIEYTTGAKEMNGNAQIIEGIRADNSGIGYVGAGYVMEKNAASALGVKVLKIAATMNENAISPLDEAAIAQNRYFFQRPLYQFIRKESASKVHPFIAFEQGPRGQAVITASGYYAVPK